MKRLVLAVLALAFLAGTTEAQVRMKDMIRKQLQQAQDTRAQQDPNANPNQPPQQPNQPAATAQATAGWMERTTPDGTKVRFYVAHPFYAPDAKPNFPALIVLQEWWGVNDDIVQRTDELAGKGYYAVAVDLYDGKVTKEPKEAAALKGKMTDAGALVRMRMGLNFLADLAGKKIVDAQKVGVAGWCMGGEQALKLAVSDPRIKAVAVFYGTPILDREKLKNLKGPVLGIFGRLDKGIPAADVEKFSATLKELKIPAQVTLYDGVGHAFASRAAAGMGMYDETKAQAAWKEFYGWLEATLGKKPA